MEPTISRGGSIAADPTAYAGHSPAVGDIVVFHPPASLRCSAHRAPGTVFSVAGSHPSPLKGVARVVARPGDVISLRHGQVIRNGRIETTPTVNYSCATSVMGGYCSLPTPVHVPRGDYFLMNDNRIADQTDSRVWGPVPASWILGKVVEITSPGQSPYIPIRGADVVVAIVGGVLLIIVLARPTIKWPWQPSERAFWSAEVGLTALAFFVGGFVFKVLFTVLSYSNLDAAARASLWCAVGIVIIYGALVHHEPFVEHGTFYWKLYGTCAGAAAFAGVIVGDIAVGGTDLVGWILLILAVSVALFVMLAPLLRTAGDEAADASGAVKDVAATSRDQPRPASRRGRGGEASQSVPGTVSFRPPSANRKVTNALGGGRPVASHRHGDRVPHVSGAGSSREKGTSSRGQASSRRPTAPDATSARVLGALSVDRGMTADEVAKATGIAVSAVTTRLNELVKNGEINKTERGYQLIMPGDR